MKNKKVYNILLSITTILFLTSLVFVDVSHAQQTGVTPIVTNQSTVFNPFSWSNTEAKIYNPFSWSNTEASWYNPFSWLPGCTNNCSDSKSSSPVVSGTLQGQPSSSNTQAGTSLTYGGTSTGIKGLFDLFQAFLSRGLTLLISLAIVYFVWNVFKYIIAAEEVDKATAKDKIVWGLVAIFVMISIWGLVAILQGTFKIFPSTTGPTINVIPKF